MGYTNADLALAAEQIADGERHVARQKDVVSRLTQAGLPTLQAQDLLHAFESTLGTYRRHHAAIQADLAARRI